MDITGNRQSQQEQQAAAEIKRQQQLGTENMGLHTVIGPNPTLGGYDVQKADGGVLRGVLPDTSRSFGKGDMVSVYIGSKGARLDAKPSGLSSSGTGSSSTDGTGTGSGVGGSSTSALLPPSLPGSSPLNDGSQPRYRPNENGECTAVYYTGATKEGDFDDAAACAGDQPNSRSWYCEDGKCYATAAGAGQYDSLAECEAAIIPGFKGGQCAGTLYAVSGTVTGTYATSGGNPAFPGHVAGASWSASWSATAIGPIGAVSCSPTSNSPETASITVNGAQGFVDLQTVSPPYNTAGTAPSTSVKATIGSTSPLGGGNDDCGDRPPKCGI